VCNCRLSVTEWHHPLHQNLTSNLRDVIHHRLHPVIPAEGLELAVVSFPIARVVYTWHRVRRMASGTPCGISSASSISSTLRHRVRGSSHHHAFDVNRFQHRDSGPSGEYHQPTFAPGTRPAKIRRVGGRTQQLRSVFPGVDYLIKMSNRNR